MWRCRGVRLLKSDSDFVKAVKIMEDGELEIIALLAGIGYQLAVFGRELRCFGGGDGDILVVEEVMPCCVD